jgi:predicted nucleic acid-binding protein
MLYADASVIVTAYLADEPDHARWRAVVLEGEEPVVSSEVVRVEVTGAFAAATRATRTDLASTLTSRFEADCSQGGPIKLLALDATPVLDRAVRLVQDHPLRALDAIHLAAALEQAAPLAGLERVTFLSRDERQSAVATALGFADSTGASVDRSSGRASC